MKNPNMALIGARRRSGLFQYDLAERAGMTPGRLSMIENRRLKPRPEEQQRIAEVLGVSVREVFDSLLDGGREG